MAILAVSRRVEPAPEEQPAPALRVFVSSPGDVADERAALSDVLKRLQGEFASRGTVEPVYWEHEPLLATAGFQEQIPLPSQCDVVVAILWTRLGTRLPPQIHRPDGSCYASGTEFEIEDAAAASRRTGRPDLLVYRKTADLQVSLRDEGKLLERLEQKRALDEFFQRWFIGQDGGSPKAFLAFADAAEFERLAEMHLRKLLDRLLPGPGPVAVRPRPVQWHGSSPYRGLSVFEVEHADIFFGRRWAIVDVLSALRTQAAAGRAFLLILGMSGCGKSSLVRAGVLPRLLLPGVIEGVGLWRRAILRPSDSDDLFAGLAAALLGQEALPELAASGTRVDELAQALAQAPQAAVALLKTGLCQAAARVAADQGLAQPPAARLVLVIDQLEELFTLEQLTAESRGAYVAAVDALARSGAVWVIATLRSDFYPRTSELAALVALKKGAGQYDLLPATPAEIGQMIRRPTRAAGLRFEVDLVTEERLDDVLRDEAARHPASLPLLEFALEELYKQRRPDGMLTFEAYRHLGGVEGALARRAEQVFESLPENVQAALPTVFRSLVTLAPAGESMASKSPQRALSSTPEVRSLVDAFVRARLFVTRLADDGTAVVELAHEALLKHWPRLSRWLEEDRENLRVASRVTAQAALWGEKGRSADYLLPAGKPLSEAAELLAGGSAQLGDLERQLVEASLARERRRRRRRHWVMASLAALALLAGASAVFAIAARRAAEARRGQARDLVGFMLGDLDDKLDPVARKDILGSIRGKVLEYFHSHAGEVDRADQLLEARALQLSSEVYQAEGRSRDAAAAGNRALELAASLAQRYPVDDAVQLELGRGYDHLGALDQARGDFDSALPRYRTAAAILDRLVARDPSRSAWQGEAATTHSNLAVLLVAKQDLAAALPECRRTLEILQAIVARDAGNEKWQGMLASSYLGLANVLNLRGEIGGTEKALLESAEVTRRLVAANPANRAAQELLGMAREHLAELAEMRGRADQAREQYQVALSIYSGLADWDPGNTNMAESLAMCHGRLGRALALAGDPRPALEHTRAGIDIMRGLLRKDPRRAFGKYLIAWLQQVSGRALLLGGNAGGAVRELRQAAASLERLGNDYQLQLATTSAVLGDALTAAGRPADARLAWGRAVALFGPSARDSYNPLALDAWARSLIQLGRGEEAKPALARLAAIGYQPARPFPRAGS